MDDDKKRPENEGDKLFEEHELDLNTPEDLEAIEDVTFSEGAHEALDEPVEEQNLSPDEEAMAVFEDFSINDEAPTEDVPSLDTTSEESTESLDIPEFDEALFTDAPQEQESEHHPTPEGLVSQEDLGYNQDNTATEILETDTFDFPAEDLPVEERSPEAISTGGDEEIFTSDAFDDVSADFPEDAQAEQLGDSQLFDYDPSAGTDESEFIGDETAFEDVDEVGDMYEAGEHEQKSGLLGGLFGKKGGGGDDGDMPPPPNKRRGMRAVILIILIIGIYSMLRLFTGGSAPSDMALDASSADPDRIASVAEQKPQDVRPISNEEAESMIDESDLFIGGTPPGLDDEDDEELLIEEGEEIEIVEVPEPARAFAPSPTPISAPVVSAQPQTGTTLNIPQPQTRLVTELPTQPTQMIERSEQSEAVTRKLTDLEASIKSIDRRLSQFSTQMEQAPQSAMPGVPAYVGGYAVDGFDEDDLAIALEKIENIDSKLSRIQDLQTQMRVLSNEMKSLKTDVVQQSMIVGQTQAEINQSMAQAQRDKQPPMMTVQAAIPGRAWLRSENGQLITVIPGDEVPGFGRVVSIDPTTGTVVMSSRAVFRES